MVSKPDHMRNADKAADRVEFPAVGRWHFDVQGVVQGVGFRPFVHRLATRHDLHGWARNTSDGIELALDGAVIGLLQFESDLVSEAPPLAHILSVSVNKAFAGREQSDAFSILPSLKSGGRTYVSPDVATCDACLREIRDPGEQRYGYAFTNCTHCGPRYTIITALPYDRERTAMRDFAMCPECGSEYGDPADRRFHAQPIACPSCGPMLSAQDSKGEHVNVRPERVLGLAGEMLGEGRILGIKGVGGFHIVCLATDAAVVERLRNLKCRPHKPFAVMIPSIDDARRVCRISDAEERLLASAEAPIVLCESHTRALPDAVAPQNGRIGLMLPYSPLHHILMDEVNAPLVFTSGNVGGEPLCTDPAEAVDRLGHLVDAFVMHNRPIVRPCDDSVVMVAKRATGGRTQWVRRSRGYAPLPVLLPETQSLEEPIVATGGDLKNVSAIAEERSVFLTQHIGDLAHPRVRALQEHTLLDMERLFAIDPAAVVCDAHPGYASSAFAERFATKRGLPLYRVQHHEAHIAGCLAENAHTGPAIGLAYDGTGYGSDGRVWGGEVLAVSAAGFHRRGHLSYLPLPGGDAGTRWPRRVAIAYLQTADPELVDRVFPDVDGKEIDLVRTMVREDVQVAWTSSMGRLFDAVAGLLGLVDEVSYEGQAAIALEDLAGRAVAVHGEDLSDQAYPFAVVDGVIRVEPMLRSIAEDILRRREPSGIARRFHETVAAFSVAAVKSASVQSDSVIDTVALSGGCWQNQMLMEMVVPLLEREGFAVLTHHNVPANDGGLAYGQAAMMSRLKHGSESVA